MKQAAAQVTDKAKAEGAELLGQARHRAEEAVEEGKAMGAEHASGFARAIRHAADDLEDTSPDIARHVRAAGESIGGIADAMRERSAGQLLDDVKGFAQRQPSLFFGAAALAGFALVRFARSSARNGTARAGSPRAGGAHAADAPVAIPPVPTEARATPAGSGPLGSPGAGQAMPPRPASPSTHTPSPLSTPAVQSGSVPNERSGSPL